VESTLTWLDYSERDRHRAMEVIDLFRETGTLDELGLAGIANSFSDLFFLGMSTGQTRACYFLLIPWMFRELERQKVSSGKVWGKARSMELRLNRLLREDEGERGVFGRNSGDKPKRLASDVYWWGLGSWGICNFPGDKRAYFRSLNAFYRRRFRSEGTEEGSEGRGPPQANWHPNIPAPPLGFPDRNFSVALRRKDALYLKERIQARHPASLLAAVARREEPSDLKCDNPWQLADHLEIGGKLREQLRDAQRFAYCMRGAALVYNLILSETAKRDDWKKRHTGSLENWANDIDALGSGLTGWKPDGVWQVVRAQGRSLGYPTQIFVKRWIEMVSSRGPRAIANDPSARALVRDREVQLKGHRARVTNPRRLELWGGASGTWLMNYRWGATKRILKDIFSWMNTGDAGNA